MGTYKIKNKPVFLTEKNYSFLAVKWNRLNRNCESPFVIVLNEKDSKKWDKFCYTYLSELYKTDGNEFYEKWFNFDIDKSEIIYNIFYLLYDYCIYYKRPFLSRKSETEYNLKAALLGENDHLPLGNTFEINLPIGGWQHLLHLLKLKAKCITVKIDVHSIQRVVGNLTDFRIIFEDEKVVRFLNNSIKFE